MATAEEIQQLRELVALQAAQLEAVAQELTAQRTATAQTEVRAGLILVETKLLSKSNVYSGEHDGKKSVDNMVVQKREHTVRQWHRDWVS